jgi:hypothetical protein
MSARQPSARWSINSAAPRRRSTPCLPCRRRGGRPSIRVFTEAEAELEAADRAGARLVGEKGYPPALAHVDAPPPLLYTKGRLDLADGPIVAMVGARNGSAVGQKLTRQLATELGLERFVTASGLARGIDTAAHLAALEQGTIAVLAGGIDIVYPPENADPSARHWRTGALAQRTEPRLCPEGQGLPPPQPPDLRHLAWVCGGGGSRAFRLPDHRPLCRRAAPGDFCRAGKPSRPTLRRHQQSASSRAPAS